ncbi:MAG: DUF1638 domain-containing protein [Chloroflexi bacterium]|nr:MAG: DUF1638 domain-containing protein [Chloroflexota bacterium]
MSTTALVICGALGREVKDIVDRRQWDVDIYGVSALLHLYPSRIVDELREKLYQLRPRYEKLVVVYGDCGTTGKLEPLLEEVGAHRLRGPHCYEMYRHVLPDRLARPQLRPRGGEGTRPRSPPRPETDAVRQLRGSSIPTSGSESKTC